MEEIQTLIEGNMWFGRGAFTSKIVLNSTEHITRSVINSFQLTVCCLSIWKLANHWKNILLVTTIHCM